MCVLRLKITDLKTIYAILGVQIFVIKLGFKTRLQILFMWYYLIIRKSTKSRSKMFNTKIWDNIIKKIVKLYTASKKLTS